MRNKGKSSLVAKTARRRYNTKGCFQPMSIINEGWGKLYNTETKTNKTRKITMRNKMAEKDSRNRGKAISEVTEEKKEHSS